MRVKPSRWFERLEDGRIAIYDAPSSAQSVSVSLVWPSDLPYYRANFHLQHVWG